MVNLNYGYFFVSNIINVYHNNVMFIANMISYYAMRPNHSIIMLVKVIVGGKHTMNVC